MNFFDSLIDEFFLLIKGKEERSFVFENKKICEDLGYQELILQRDTAFELSGHGFNLITNKTVSDGVTVVGKELSEIKGDKKFLRVSLISTEDITDEQKAHGVFRKIEYTKYHTFPKGYMMRSSSGDHRENVRVSKKALKEKISFEKVGNLLISKYKENPAVKGVRIYFICEDTFDYGKGALIAKKADDITKALNHVLQSLNFDCDTCNLKPVCDEVEGMRELHFKKGMG